jgi:hypothetical protein
VTAADCPHLDAYRVGPTTRFCRACSSTTGTRLPDGATPDQLAALDLELDLVVRAHLAGRHLEARRLAAQVLAGHPPPLPLGMPPA